MKILRFYILNRLVIIAILIVLGILSQVLNKDLITAWICYVLAFISLLLYFMMGTMRLVQEAVSDGDVDKAQMYIRKIKFPRLLLKPIRSGYYMLQSNLSLASDDLTTAESNIRKSLNTKSSIVGDVKGTNLMQLGFIQLNQGKTKEARLTLMEAVKAGIPDKESMAAVYLQLCSIEIQRKQNKIGKEYFRKAKALKPKSEEIVKQLNMMGKNIDRLPG
ncbi:MAG: tetratricopeptide repeat protein [Bacteroidia bacterium]